MGDPLSVAAGIVALLQLASSITTSLRDIKAASKDCKRLLLEISTTRGILATLSDAVHDVKDSDAWAVTIKTLSDPSGPLSELQSLLQELDGRTKAVALSTGMKKITRSVVWPFTSKETENAIRAVERQKALLGLALGNDHMLLSQEIKRETAATNFGVQQIQKGVENISHSLTLVEKEQQDFLISETMFWLSPLRFQAKQNDVFSKRSGKSGSWLLQTPEFRAWTAGAQDLLFCPGIAGAGKTVLTSVVVDHLLTQRGHEDAVLFVYCNYADKDSQSVENLLGSLITQLVQQRMSLMKDIVGYYKQSGRKNCASLDHAEYSQLLATTARYFRRIFLVVDALDESDEDTGARLALLQEMQALQPTVRTLVTSRPHGSIEQAFLGVPRVEIYARDADIEEYVRSRLEKDHRLYGLIKSDVRLQLLLKDGVIEKCQGMFLLATLHMDALSKSAKYSKAAVRAAVDQLPSELDLTYDDALGRINSQDEDDACLAKQVLAWVFFTYEPFSMRLLQQALACQRGNVASDEESFINPELLISVCAGLAATDAATQTVHLVHYTTQDYLRRHPQHIMPNALTAISSTCLNHLLTTNIPHYLCEKPPQELDRFYYEERESYYANLRAEFIAANPFTIYAICHLTQHLQARPDPSLLGATQELWKSSKLPLLQQACMILKGPSRRTFRITKPYPPLNELQFAAFFGFESEARRILESGVQLAKLGGRVEEPGKSSCLCIAASMGYDNLVSMLLDKGIKSTTVAEVYQAEQWDALNCAIEGSHKSTVDLLITKSPELVKRRSNVKFRTALHFSARGRPEIVKSLIQQGADIDAKDIWGQVPLHWAVTLESSRAIPSLKCLLQNGAVVDACDNDGWTPLTLASMSTNYEIMNVLLSHGADVNGKGRSEDPLAVSGESRASKSPSPLSFAVQNGNVHMVRVLLEKGAIVTSTKGELDNQFHRPRENASEMGRLLTQNNPKAAFFGGELAASNTELICQRRG